MQKDRGFVGWLIMLVIALAALKYFLNWSIFDAAASPQGNATLAYMREVLNTSWAYILNFLIWIWDKFAEFTRGLLWNK